GCRAGTAGAASGLRAGVHLRKRQTVCRGSFRDRSGAQGGRDRPRLPRRQAGRTRGAVARGRRGRVHPCRGRCAGQPREGSCGTRAEALRAKCAGWAEAFGALFAEPDLPWSPAMRTTSPVPVTPVRLKRIPLVLAPLTFASLALALVGCGQNGSATAPQSVQAENQTPAPSSEPVEQGPPNNADAQPAFPEQTRAPASPSNVSLAVETVAEGIEEPWAAAVLPRDGALLVTARTGKLWLIEPGAEKREVSGAPEVDARDQGGLLDISLGPDFMTARTVYLTFSEPRGDGKNSTSLARATLSEDRTRLENVTTIFRQEPAWASNLHFGSNLEWDSAGNLYLTLGERSLPEPRQLAQDLSTHIGKVVRL